VNKLLEILDRYLAGEENLVFPDNIQLLKEKGRYFLLIDGETALQGSVQSIRDELYVMSKALELFKI